MVNFERSDFISFSMKNSRQSLTAAQIAEFLGGVVEGDPHVVVSDIARIEEGRKGCISFLSNPKYTSFLYTTKSSIVLIDENFELEKPVEATLIRVSDAYGALPRLLGIIGGNTRVREGVEEGVHVGEGVEIAPTAWVGAGAYLDEGAKVGPGCQIYPFTYLGEGVVVGEDTTIYPGAVIYAGCELGKRCIIHAGAVIGADGFGFAPDGKGGYVKIPQLGNVLIGDDVEVGANTCVDRAAMGATELDNGVKIDNLVQVAHNVTIGANTAIAAQTGIAGSTKIGQGCKFGGQVGIAGHLRIADGVELGAQAGVLTNLEPVDSQYQGSPVVPVREFFRIQALLRRLPDMARDLEALKRKLEEK